MTRYKFIDGPAHLRVIDVDNAAPGVEFVVTCVDLFGVVRYAVYEMSSWRTIFGRVVRVYRYLRTDMPPECEAGRLPSGCDCGCDDS